LSYCLHNGGKAQQNGLVALLTNKKGAKLTSFRIIALFCEKLSTYLAKKVAFATTRPKSLGFVSPDQAAIPKLMPKPHVQTL
jgi:hypothetical protein